jgi:hypothetical protein
VPQGLLFDEDLPLPPAARGTDAPSSHLAAEEHTASGRRQRNMDAVLALVKAHPGSTSVELCASGGGVLERHEVSRRLSDLERLVRIARGPHRVCRVNKREMLTWFAL